MQANAEGYGHTPGQIGAMKAGKLDAVVTSPPWADCLDMNSGEGLLADVARRHGNNKARWEAGEHKDYGATPGQIGAMKAGKLDAVVTSPPYGDISQTGGTKGLKEHGTGLTAGERSFTEYGDTAGNLGNDSGDTYWQAVAAVYEQCRIALRPGGIMVVVCKDYVSKGKRVPLCDQTAVLLNSLGFQPVERIRASLIDESVSEGFWGTVTERKERKSFFRRLAESKGSPRIDYEEVLCMRKGDPCET